MITFFKGMSGKYGVRDNKSHSKEMAKKLQALGLPVYKSMSGNYRVREMVKFTKEEVLEIKAKLSKK